LHIESFRNAPISKTALHFLPHDDDDKHSILVLAGDISSSVKQLVEFIREIHNRFESIVMVPGNHEFYGHHLDNWVATINKEMSQFKNVFYAADQKSVSTFILGNIRFICGTIWADGGKDINEMQRVQNALYDFVHILYGENGEIFRVADMQHLHEMQVKTLQQELEKPFHGKTVVVSHHLPSLKLVSSRFNDPVYGINGGFASSLDGLMTFNSAPWLWVFGHTHDTIDMQLNRTRCVCNPCGYQRETNSSPFNSYRPRFISLE